MTVLTWVLVALFAGVTILDLMLAYIAMQKKTTGGKILGVTCVCAAFVTASYLLSIFVENYFWYSVLSSLYFIGIDLALLELAWFGHLFTHGGKAVRPGKGWLLLFSWGTVDIVFLVLNPFVEISIHYIHHQGSIAFYTYEMMLPYQLHLLLAYVLIAVVLAELIKKILEVPSFYKRQYVYIILSLLLVVAINALYLYMPSAEGVPKLDYSLLGYSVAGFLFYWVYFVYVPKSMSEQLRQLLFERIGQGILLFDYKNELVMENKKAAEIFGETAWHGEPTAEKLLEFLDAGISSRILEPDSDITELSFQYYPENQSSMRSMRCEYSALKGRKKERLGCLFAFMDLLPEYDTLTGFISWEVYRKREGMEQVTEDKPVTAAVCDINGLADINRELGQNIGDQAIQRLARRMQECFPPKTLFVRGREASLAAVCEGLTAEETAKRLENLEKRMLAEPFFGTSIHIQSAVKIGEPSARKESIIQGAMETLRIRKMLDQNSKHSEVLYSLIRALQECDPDTEAHVRRTQKLGGRLARRMELTEEDQSRLSLLAIMHDIGKIGIPLDILNKPGKLSEAEWNVLKTHVEKGYQIARSSEGLRGIADMILYHHERWDGQGYPEGLSKESIPLLSRMIAVVDAYDAMVNDRSYRAAMPPENACRELKRCAGTQFDPAIVSTFLQIMKEDGVEAAEQAAPAIEEGREQWSVPSQNFTREKIPRIHTMQHSCYLTDQTGRILQVDDSFETLTGYSREDVQEKELRQTDLIFEEDREEYYSLVRELGQRSTRIYLEHQIRRKDGGAVFVYCYGRRYYDSAEKQERTEIIISDSASSYSVQSVVRLERGKAFRRLERWENKFRRDPLTGLLNHEAFKNDVETRILASQERAMMLMMDVDYFKEYNDTHGHRAGDEYLIMVSQTLMSALRKEDFACRMGGDEFAAILFFDDDTSEKQMEQRAAQICDRINLTLNPAGSGSGVSMGVAFLGKDGESFDRLYEAADRALYRAKENGRGRLSF